MVLVLSRFKVSNGLEAQVRAAFIARPHLVDGAAGFLGFEVFTDDRDPTVFHLLTRWTDRAAFESWHGSDAHHASHRWIPKGLKLDATFTRVEVLERISDPAPTAIVGEAIADAVPLVERFLLRSSSTILVAGDRDGMVRACNAAFAKLVGMEVAEVVGRPVFPLLTEGDGPRLRERLAAAPGSRHSTLVNVLEGGVPRTIDCELDIRPDGFVLVGEVAAGALDSTTDELRSVNNELAVLARAEARRSKRTEQARVQAERSLRDLQGSHWHIRKLQETLPICMGCSKVKTADGAWQSVAEYLKGNSLFLSHGFCPECGQQELDMLDGPL